MKRIVTFILLSLILLSLLGNTATAHSCVDRDRDYWCDDCGMLISHTCIDTNKDAWCDKCSCWIPHDCTDKDGDHQCDQCGKVMDVNINITVTSASSGQQDVTLYFYEGNYPSVFATVSGSPAQHTFKCAANSRFQLHVMKYGHPTRTFYYNTYQDDINIHVDLYPYGDVSQDGKVTVGDVARVYAWAKTTEEPNDDYIFQCADANSDGVINVGDTARIYAHVKQSKPLW